MRNYKLSITYDGTRYKGWQRLSYEQNTIQGILEQAISDLLGYDITINGSGRTDAGVHANEQIANVKVAGKLNVVEFKKILNTKLPQDIVVNSMELVKNNFHGRYSAKGKCYVYSIDQREKPSVFTKQYTYHFPYELNNKEMQKAIDYLVGTHDFTSFCDKKEDKSCVRTIDGIELTQNGHILTIKYRGDGFLNHMVRILTGTLLEVGVGKKNAMDIPLIIDNKKRLNAGFTAPARGLCLDKVYY